MLRASIFLLECIASGVFLWLGLYLITRDHPARGQHTQRWWQRPALAIGVAILCEAAAIVGVAMGIISDDPRDVVFWARLTWWPEPFAFPALFWGVICVIAPDATSLATRRWGRLASLALLVAATCFAVVGTATNLIFRFDAVVRMPQPPQYLVLSPGVPGYWFLFVFSVGTLLSAAFLHLRHDGAARDEARRGTRWLGAGTAVLTVGAAISRIGSAPGLGVSPELGDTLLVMGLFLLGYGVARHNALLQHRVITQDFYRSLAGAAVTSGLFLLVFGGFHALSAAPLTP